MSQCKQRKFIDVSIGNCTNLFLKVNKMQLEVINLYLKRRRNCPSNVWHPSKKRNNCSCKPTNDQDLNTSCGDFCAQVDYYVRQPVNYELLIRNNLNGAMFTVNTMGDAFVDGFIDVNFDAYLITR